MTGTSRRSLLLGLALLPPLEALATTLPPTPRQSRGPFYPDRLPLDQDNDLLRVAGSAASAEGQVTHVLGRVLDPAGRPLAGAKVEIWQCDARGRYIHSRDAARGGGDAAFQGYGQTLTDAEGRYRFRTIRPVPYPGRTPHIHFSVAANGFRELVTQMYVEGEPLNARDGLLNRITDPAARARLMVALGPAPELEAGALAGTFDIVLDA